MLTAPRSTITLQLNVTPRMQALKLPTILLELDIQIKQIVSLLEVSGDENTIPYRCQPTVTHFWQSLSYNEN
jgi:hypothetical protein